MSELKKSAFIELTLFEESTNKSSQISVVDEKKNTRIRPNKKVRLKSKSVSQKRNLQKTWEEMYKSVEKSKGSALSEEDSPLESMEEKLTHLKKLRDNKKISEQEYQRRKGRLLSRF